QPSYNMLFETHPDVQEVFMSFQGIELEELKHSKQLRSHALRVMGFVQKTVARLHEPEKLDVLLRELGKKHHGYSAKQEYIDLIGPQFIQAIKPSLEDKWSPELHTAWAKLFEYMSSVMKEEMDKEEKRVLAEEAAKAAKSKASIVPGAHRHHHKSNPNRRASSDAVGGGSSGGPLAAIRRGTMH
ncbi:cytoglobin-2-like, partial [Ischnura elegans]|uniref:cytoglobin-2-like n=1 Tax=Ischnura elegans TaxID=197161 RepID=UPI001ED89D3C